MEIRHIYKRVNSKYSELTGQRYKSQCINCGHSTDDYTSHDGKIIEENKHKRCISLIREAGKFTLFFNL